MPATTEEVRRAIADVYAMAADRIDWACKPHELSVVRLDLARDFSGVAGAHSLLEELSHLPARGRTSVWRGRNCAGAQTVYRKTQRWVARLYDRGAMYEDRARALRKADRSPYLALAEQARNTVRFELELRPRLLAEVGIYTWLDLNDGRAEALAREYFRVCRFDELVGGAEGRIREAAAQARARGDGEYREVGLAVGQVVFDAIGMAPPASEKTVRKRRSTALAYGLTPCNLFSPSLGVSRGWVDTGR